MSYGQNQPWGLQAIKTTTGAPWNGQTNPYFIQSGYANNIFKGDLVYLGGDGYIHNLSEQEAARIGAYQAIGVFNGCSFQTTTATNPIDPASPGRPYWPANTATLNGVPAIADIIDDPSVVFNIQSNGAVAFNSVGNTAAVAYTYISNTNVSGNYNTGASNMVLDNGTIGVGLNLRILRFVPVSGNVPGINYNNVEVLIQNHSFASRPAGL